MLKIDLINTDSDQVQIVELDELETEIRVFWNETPDHITAITGNQGVLMMNIKNSVLDIKSIGLTRGSELMIPYARSDFGGFIIVGDEDPTLDFTEWELMYIPSHELDEIRNLYGQAV